MIFSGIFFLIKQEKLHRKRTNTILTFLLSIGRRGSSMAKSKTAGVTTAKSVVDNAAGIESMGKMGEGLSQLNTMRGGEKGFKGLNHSQ